MNSTQGRQLVIKQAAKNKLVNFCEVVNLDYQASWHHEILCAKLQEGYKKLTQGISSRYIIETPPRHGKSLTSTILFPTWILGHDPRISIIVCAHTAKLAEKFGLDARDVMENPNYREIFGNLLRHDIKARGNWMTHKGGGYMATGIGGPITGKGFSIGIVDDPFKNREEANSQAVRDGVWNWWLSTFYTRQANPSLMVVIGTRWHLDDLIGRIENQETKLRNEGVAHDEWEYITFKAIAEEDEEYRKKGDALWPQKFPIEKLEIVRSELGPYEFASLYQQSPLPLGNQEFKQEWLKHYRPDEIRHMNLEFYTTVDPAIGEKETADNSVITTVAKDRNGPNWYRIEESAGHMNPLQLIDAIFMHYEAYRSKIWIETVAYQKALKFFLIEEQKKRNLYFLINELKANAKKAKSERIRGLVPLYAAGVVFHRKGLDDAYERELLEFPNSARDDRIDAMASMLEAMSHTDYEDDSRVREQDIKFDPY